MKLSKKSVFACLFVMLMSVSFNVYSQDQNNAPADDSKEITPAELNGSDEILTEAQKQLAKKAEEDAKKADEERVAKIREEATEKADAENEARIAQINRMNARKNDYVDPSNLEKLDLVGMGGLNGSSTRKIEATATGLFGFKYKIKDTGLTDEKLRAEIKKDILSSKLGKYLTADGLQSAVNSEFEKRKSEINAGRKGLYATGDLNTRIGLGPFVKNPFEIDLEGNGAIGEEHKIGKNGMIGYAGKASLIEHVNGDGPNYGLLTALGVLKGTVGNKKVSADLAAEAGLGLGHVPGDFDLAVQLAANLKLKLPALCKNKDGGSRQRCLEITTGLIYAHLLVGDKNIVRERTEVMLPVTNNFGFNTGFSVDYAQTSNNRINAPKQIDGGVFGNIYVLLDGAGQVNKARISRAANDLNSSTDEKKADEAK